MMSSVIQEYTTLAQWGSSKAVKEQSIILTPEAKASKTIYELFADWQDDGIRQEEVDWGQATGEELSDRFILDK